MVVATLNTVEGGVVELEAEVLLFGFSDSEHQGSRLAFAGYLNRQLFAHLVETGNPQYL